MIRAENVTRVYGSGDAKVLAIDDISLQIQDGEMVAITGTSGSGKSTLLHILSGLDVAASGSVCYDDTNILKMNEKDLADFRLHHVGFVFQSFQLIPEMTAEENIRLPLLMAKQPSTPDAALIKRLGLDGRLHHYPDELSGGQKQRVAIARALSNHPDVIFADEPTGALDSKTAAEIMDVFGKLHSEGKTIIIVTHDMSVARQCERVIEISDGKIVG